MVRRWAVGDVHGCAKTLKALLETQIKITLEDEIYFLGDYIDRGPASMGVVSYIMELRMRGYKIRTLRGNHEQMLLDHLVNPGLRNNWFYNGGLNTLRSFSVHDVREIPFQFISFMESLEYYIELDEFVLVHAGFNFEIENPFADKNAMLWIRNDDIVPDKIKHKKMVHGHTPLPLETIKKGIEDPHNYDIDLDNGCVYFDIEGLGRLCALELNTMTLAMQENLDVWG